MSEDKNIPVYRKADLSIHWLNVKDICFSTVESNQIIYHTRDDIFYHLKNFDDIVDALNEEDFEKVDRSSLVQLDKVTFYDSEYGKVFFDPVVTSRSKYATVSRKYMDKVIARLGATKDIAKK